MKPIEAIYDYIDNIPKRINTSDKQFQKILKRYSAELINLEFKNRLKETNFHNIWCPTLTTGCSIYSLRMKRPLNIREYLKLQGFPVNFKQVVSDTQFKKQIGNSMSVNVLEELFKEIFKIIPIRKSYESSPSSV